MALGRAGELSVRISYHLFPQVPGQELADLTRFTEMVKPGQGDEWLRVNGAGRTWPGRPPTTRTSPSPARSSRWERQLSSRQRSASYSIAVGAFVFMRTYGETIAMDLDVFSKIAGDGGFPRGVSWFFDHAETVSEQSLDRIAELGGSLSVQNRMMFQGRAFVDRYGAERAAVAPPDQAHARTRSVVAAGTDATRVASYNPWLSLEWLVRGRDIGGLLLTPAKNRVDRETALRMYTAGSASLTGEVRRQGHYEGGLLRRPRHLVRRLFQCRRGSHLTHRVGAHARGRKGRLFGGPYEGIAPPAPVISPPWSPVAHFGGFHSSPVPSGLEQAETVAEVAAASDEQLKWRLARGAASSLATEHSDHSCSLL